MCPQEREIEGGFPFHKLTYQRIRPSLNCNVAVRACQHPRFREVTTALPCFWIVGSHIQSPIQQPPSSSYCTAVLYCPAPRGQSREPWNVIVQICYTMALCLWSTRLTLVVNFDRPLGLRPRALSKLTTRV